MAVPTFVAQGASYATSSAWTAGEPAGGAEDDLYVEVTQLQTNEAALVEGIIVPPTGWSEPSPSVLAQSNAGQYGGHLSYIRRAAAVSMDFTEAGSQNHIIGSVFGFRGVDATTPLILDGWTEHAARPGGTTTFTIPSFSTAYDDALACVAIYHPANVGGTFSSVVGATCGAFTSRGFVSSNFGTDGMMDLWTCDMATAGGTGLVTVTHPDTATWRYLNVASQFTIESQSGSGGGGSAGTKIVVPYYYNS